MIFSFKMLFFSGVLGGSGPRTDGYVVKNHGDRFRPLSRVVGPLPNGRTPWFINGGDPNHLLSEMILPVAP